MDYAEAGIPEYWMVDPRDDTIRVLELRADGYTVVDADDDTEPSDAGVLTFGIEVQEGISSIYPGSGDQVFVLNPDEETRC